MAGQTCLNDASFGPAVRGCRDNFDFTVGFENIMFSIVPDCLFLASFLVRLAFLVPRPSKIHAPGLILGLKLIVCAALTGINLSRLVLSTEARSSATPPSQLNASYGLDFAAALALIVCSWLEHTRSHRPSLLLCIYLFITVLVSIARCRTLWLISYDPPDNGNYHTLASLLSAQVALEVALLALEAVNRKRWLGPSAPQHGPEETASVFELGLFAWIYPLLRRGYRAPLKLDDLYALDQTLHVHAVEPNPRQGSPWAWLARLDEKRFGNIRLLMEALGVRLAQPILPRLCLMAFRFCQPLFLRRLVDYLQEINSGGARDHQQQNTAYGLIGASVIIYLGLAISTSLYWYFQDRTLTYLRGCLVSRVYQKTTQVSAVGADDGAAVTLMSSDVERICTGLRFGHETWACVVESALACWLLHDTLGNAFVAPLVVVLLSFVASLAVSRFAGRYQKVWMRYIQERVALTSAFLAGLQRLRVAGLAAGVAETVQHARVRELAKGGRFRSVVAISAALSQAPAIVSPVVAFAFAFGPLGNPAATTSAFTALSYIILLAGSLQWLLQSVPQISAAMACLDRIRTYLDKPSWHDYRAGPGTERDHPTEGHPAEGITVGPDNANEKFLAQETASQRSITDSDFGTEKALAVRIRNGAFGWKQDADPLLKDIDLDVVRSSIAAVTGPIASGKSTLCRSILGEIPVASGTVAVSARQGVAYCDQDPYLWNGTLRENIVGYSSFDTARYEEVIEAAALLPDLAVLADGDETRVGSKGASLSGGQKQRVSLARALYHHADLLVLDDVFKGLDAKTGRHVWQRVFGPEGIVRRRRATVVLCTHSAEFARQADHVVRLTPGGTIDYQGSPSDLPVEADGADLVKVAGGAEQQEEELPVSMGHQTAPGPGGDGRAKDKKPHPKKPATPESPVTDLSVYRHYASSVGLLPILSFATLALIIGFCQVFPSVWLEFWTYDTAQAQPKHSFAYYIGIYALLAAGALACTLPAGFVTMGVMVRLSGSRLHRATLETITHASLHFLTRTDAGFVLNYFSQDMTIVDTQLPGSVTNLGIVVAVCVGQAVVIATSSPYLAISYAPLLGLLYLVQRLYLPTSKPLRILDLEAKSPLYAHFLDTLSGLVTLRAYGWLPRHTTRNGELLETSQRPFYLLAMAQQWLTLTMNVIVLVLAVLLVTLSTQLGSQPGFAAAGLVNLIGFGTILTGIISAYTMLEISLGGIARLRRFSQTTEQEDREGEDVVPAEEWPSAGAIEMRHVSAAYGTAEDGPDAVLALDNISLSIRAGSKVALCGRTGSGKSTLFALLLRLLDPVAPASPADPSDILIDNLPLRGIDRSTLRQRIIAVPQDPVFLPSGSSSTIRANLDPSALATADECTLALAAVALSGIVDVTGGLDAALDPGALSYGQQKLFMLARAVVRLRIRQRVQRLAGAREGGILLLDEIGAGVDATTERTFLEILHKEFTAYTVVSITHSEDVAREYDRRIQLSDGRVVEDTGEL